MPQQQIRTVTDKLVYLGDRTYALVEKYGKVKPVVNNGLLCTADSIEELHEKFSRIAHKDNTDDLQFVGSLTSMGYYNDLLKDIQELLYDKLVSNRLYPKTQVIIILRDV